MKFEIERKFLVRSDDWRKRATSQIHLRQAYLSTTPRASIRVRITNEEAATLTIESRMEKLRQLEFEYVIPLPHADALVLLRQGCIIEKDRYFVPWGRCLWQIDVFSGENHGLIVAEIELESEEQKFELPHWVGMEITGQWSYYNSCLAQIPFSSWRPHQESDRSTETLPEIA